VVHTVLAGKANLPISQLVQLALPSWAAMAPAGQFGQVLWAARLYVPVAHCLQVGAASPENVPAMQLMQVAAAVPEKVPGWHSRHEVMPMLGVYLPPGQLTQFRLFGAYFPMAHELHSVSPTSEILPTAQVRQEGWPAKGWYLPATQSVHT
jgi:hypothetical protein